MYQRVNLYAEMAVDHRQRKQPTSFHFISLLTACIIGEGSLEQGSGHCLTVRDLCETLTGLPTASL